MGIRPEILKILVETEFFLQNSVSSNMKTIILSLILCALAVASEEPQSIDSDMQARYDNALNQPDDEPDEPKVEIIGNLTSFRLDISRKPMLDRHGTAPVDKLIPHYPVKIEVRANPIFGVYDAQRRSDRSEILAYLQHELDKIGDTTYPGLRFEDHERGYNLIVIHKYYAKYHFLSVILVNRFPKPSYDTTPGYRFEIPDYYGIDWTSDIELVLYHGMFGFYSNLMDACKDIVERIDSEVFEPDRFEFGMARREREEKIKKIREQREKSK